MKIAALVLSYNDAHHLKDCYDSLSSQTEAPIIFHIDNASPDGAVSIVEKNYPEVKILKMGANLGFATAYNRAIDIVFREIPDLDAVLLLNSDTFSDKKMIEELSVQYQNLKSSDRNIGLVQPAVLLFDEPALVNTIGNTLHFLGFGFCKNLRSAYKANSPSKILSVSGCAMLVSREYYNRIGGFDDAFYMYCEDQNYSWRGLMQGFNHYVTPSSIVYHKYKFSNSNLRWYNSEKNRLIMLLTNLEAVTLIKLLPAIIVLEPLIIVFGLLKGFGGAKLRSLFYVLSNLPSILKLRRDRQLTRTVSDNDLLPMFDSELIFGPVTNPLIEKVINPCLRGYKQLISR